MQAYIGYGFDVNDVSNADLLNLMRKHDPSRFERFANSIRGNEDIINEKQLEAVMRADVRDHIMEDFMDSAAYLQAIINAGEKEAAGTDCVVYVHNQFLSFDSIRFATDEKRGEYIRSQADFIQMIARYIPVENLNFGNIYTGSKWTGDECYQE